MKEFRARTFVRVEKIDAKGVLVVLSGWNHRKQLRFKTFPIILHLDKKRNIYISYATVNLKAERAKDLNLVWCT